jgi:hypothetical protein
MWRFTEARFGREQAIEFIALLHLTPGDLTASGGRFARALGVERGHHPAPFR